MGLPNAMAPTALAAPAAPAARAPLASPMRGAAAKAKAKAKAKPAAKKPVMKPAMKASKIATGKHGKRDVFHGKKEKTRKGLKKEDLIKSKANKIVSKRES